MKAHIESQAMVSHMASIGEFAGSIAHEISNPLAVIDGNNRRLKRLSKGNPDLVKIIETEANEKISLATVYNTIHAFEKKGYLKEIPIDSNQSYFDTNVTDHHHFYDISEKKLIDLDKADVGPINIQKSIPGKKIKSVEVLVKLDTDNQ